MCWLGSHGRAVSARCFTDACNPPSCLKMSALFSHSGTRRWAVRSEAPLRNLDPRLSVRRQPCARNRTIDCRGGVHRGWHSRDQAASDYRSAMLLPALCPASGGRVTDLRCLRRVLGQGWCRDVPAGMVAAAAVASSAPPERVASRCLIGMDPCSKVIGWKVIAHNYIEGAVTTTKPCQTSGPREVSAGNKITPDASNVLAWACLCRMLPGPGSCTRAPRQLAAAQATWVNRFADAAYKGTWLSQGRYCRWTRSGTHCVSSQDENPNWVVGFRPPRCMTRRCTPSDAAKSW